jgi:hypothetical protein
MIDKERRTSQDRRGDSKHKNFMFRTIINRHAGIRMQKDRRREKA